MVKNRRIVLVTYDNAELLDIAGPTGVFSTANRVAEKCLYDIAIISPLAAIVSHSCGTKIASTPMKRCKIGPNDTVLVVGANARPLGAAMSNAHLTQFLISAAQKAERIGSICTGAFILAAAGLLASKTVATHWSAVSEFRRRYPDVNCNAEASYINDGKLWTSAGVATGIDMALAILEHDHGSMLKTGVARQLVVYSHRPGYQSQFSDLLEAQMKEDERFRGLITWLQESVAKPISVERMADHMRMSPRTFHRRFVGSFGLTPAKFLETLRMNAARQLLGTRTSIANITRKVGFKSESAFRAAFKAHFGVTPHHYRQTWRTS